MANSSEGAAKTAGDFSDTVATGAASMTETTPPKAPADESHGGDRPKAPPKSGESSPKVTRIGDFDVKKKLGQGGMGVVYLAHQISLDRPVALKVLSKELAARKGFVDRFVREARSMAKINHPSVVNCFHVGEEKGLHFVAMELMDGQSMQDWLNQLKKIPVADAVLVTIVCGEALQHAHSMNMVHRDVKPDNILVTKKGIVKVSDLGLAKALDDEEMSMTQSGTGLGTPHYMPPEQARNAKHVDATCDVYALGSTLYHFVTGQVPFSADSVVELILNKEKGNYKPARQLNREVSDRLSLIIDKAMAKDKKARYQSCADFVKDLEELHLAGESLTFISGDKSVLRRTGASTGAATRSHVNLPPVPAKPKSSPNMRTSAEDAARSKPVGDGEWFVRHTGSDGHTKISKMSAAQVVQLMKSDRLDMKTQAAISAKGPFLPLAQIPVFQDESKKLVTRQTVKSRDISLAAEYAKIDRQVKRQKWWRLLARFRDGTLGLVGLILYLALVAGVIVGGVFAFPYVKTYIQTQLNK